MRSMRKYDERTGQRTEAQDAIYSTNIVGKIYFEMKSIIPVHMKHQLSGHSTLQPPYSRGISCRDTRLYSHLIHEEFCLTCTGIITFS